MSSAALWHQWICTGLSSPRWRGTWWTSVFLPGGSHCRGQESAWRQDACGDTGGGGREEEEEEEMGRRKGEGREGRAGSRGEGRRGQAGWRGWGSGHRRLRGDQGMQHPRAGGSAAFRCGLLSVPELACQPRRQRPNLFSPRAEKAQHPIRRHRAAYSPAPRNPITGQPAIIHSQPAL